MSTLESKEINGIVIERGENNIICRQCFVIDIPQTFEFRWRPKVQYRIVNENGVNLKLFNIISCVIINLRR